MLDQNLFTETIREVAEIIRTSSNTLSEEDILKYFESMELNENQERMVLDYLLKTQASTEDPSDHSENNEKLSDDDERIREYAKDDADELPQSPVFRMYMDEIRELSVCTKEELEDFYEDLLAGEVEALKKISDSWMIRVVDIAKELSVTPEDFSDVIQEGNMGLFMKLSELCGSQERVDVEQALEASIFMAMKAYVQELGIEDNVENTMVGKATLVNEARKYLMEENGQEPTISELVAYTHMESDELEEIIDMIQRAENKS